MSEVSYNISGLCDPSFEQVKKVFIENFNVRDELGASVCVYKDNKKVAELIVLVKDTGGLKYASKIMKNYQKEALNILSEFPNSDAKNSLELFLN